MRDPKVTYRHKPGVFLGSKVCRANDDRKKKAIARGREQGWVTDRDKAKLYARVICAICRKKTIPEVRTIDHIIPLVNGGLHHRNNLQMLCRSCNSRKGTREGNASTVTELRGKR